MTNDEKLKCLEREIKMRERVYPRWVEEGRMSQKFADRELASMREIADDYRATAEKERLI